MIFHPAPYPAGDWQPKGLAFEDAWIETDDGAVLHGWFVEHPKPRAVALFAHGNAGNVSSRAESLRILNQHHGLSVLIFDYRGFGRSQGSPTESNLLADARAARRWLARRTRVAEQDILLMGRSLGGAVAVDLAASDGARGLVIASTFTSLPDVGAHHYPWLPVHWMMSHRLDSLRKIRSFNGPLLQSHGDADEVIPIELGRRLHAAAPGPKRFIIIAGGRHHSSQTDEYRTLLDAFIDALPPPTQAWRAEEIQRLEKELKELWVNQPVRVTYLDLTDGRTKVYYLNTADGNETDLTQARWTMRMKYLQGRLEELTGVRRSQDPLGLPGPPHIPLGQPAAL